MSDRIDFGGKPWRAIPQELLRDQRLSAAARGGLVTLLSHDEGWVRSVMAILQRQNHGLGRTGARAIMRELVAAGYAERTSTRGPGGRFQPGFVVYAVPRQEQVPADQPAPTTAAGGAVPPPVKEGVEGPEPSSSRGAAGRGAVTHPPVVEALEVDTQHLTQGQHLAAVPAAPRRDELFEAVAEACGIDWHDLTRTARGSLNGAVGQLREVGATPDEVRRRAQHWPYDVALTPPGLAKHWPALATVRPKASATARHGQSLAQELEERGL